MEKTILYQLGQRKEITDILSTSKRSIKDRQYSVMGNILELQVLDILQQRWVKVLVRMKKHQHAWTLKQIVVVFVRHMVNEACAVFLVFHTQSCHAATSLGCFFTLTLSFRHRCYVLPLTWAVQILVVSTMLPNSDSKSSMPGISVVKLVHLLKIWETHPNHRYKIFWKIRFCKKKMVHKH
jgi:hypothetical protein